MGAANRLRARLGKAEVLHLALRDQVLDRARDIFDGNVRVDAMLIEQIDGVDLKTLERGLGDLLDVFRPAVERVPFAAVWGLASQPNLVAITTFPRKGARASPTSSSFVNGP